MTRARKKGIFQPVPVTSHYWWREYEGIWRTVDSFPAYEDDFGENWVRKMRAHYHHRLAHMYEHRPTNIRLMDLRKIPQD